MMIKIDCERLSKLYEDDRLTFKEIGKIFNCTKQTVMKKARAYGIKSRSRWDFPHKRGVDHPLWKGGYITPAGYVRLHLPGGEKIMEHRFVWGAYHGKPVPKGRVIHHLNGIRDDNRIENLALLSKAGHTKVGNAEVYKARIRQLERENKQLRRQMNLL